MNATTKTPAKNVSTSKEITGIQLNFKGYIIAKQKAAISASSLVKDLQAVESLKTDFLIYMESLKFVAEYEGTNTNWSAIISAFQVLEPAQFVKLLALNCKDTAKIDGRSFLTALKAAAKVNPEKWVNLV